MKIALAYPLPRRHTGVDRKINALIREFLRNDIELKIFFWTKDKTFKSSGYGEEVVNSTVFYVTNYFSKYLPKHRIFWRLIYEVQVLEGNWALFKAIQKETFEVLYLRDFRASFVNYWFFKKLKKRGIKVISELNSIIENEIEIKSQGSAWYQFELTMEKEYRRKINSQLSGAIGVTSEIVRFYRLNHSLSCKAVTIGNGIEASSYSKQRRQITHSKLKICMLVTTRAAWYGFDRIAQSLNNYKGERFIEFWVIGFSEANKVYNNSSLNFVSFMENNELDDFLTDAHAMVSSMGMYKIGLLEGATLKVRDAISRGIPIILGYNDVDLKENHKWVYHVSNDNSLIPFEKIEKWLYDLYRDSDELELTIKDFAINNLDFKVKGAKTINFISQVAMD